MTYNTIKKNNERFDPANYPKAMSELTILRSGISNNSIILKVEIVVYFMKYHVLPIAWVEANPALTRMVTSGFFKTVNLESLFELYSTNKFFIQDLEEYIGKQLLTEKN